MITFKFKNSRMSFALMNERGLNTRVAATQVWLLINFQVQMWKIASVLITGVQSGGGGGECMSDTPVWHLKNVNLTPRPLFSLLTLSFIPTFPLKFIFMKLRLK